MKSGAVDILFLHGNPMHDLPVAAGFAEGLANVPFVVSFGSEVDESVVQADLVLRITTISKAGLPTRDACRRSSRHKWQPAVVTALYDTRATTT